MNDKDWILRIKGKHAVTVYADGEVRYSVGKKTLFYLTDNALQELESLLKLSLRVPSDSATGNVIRFKHDKKVFTLYNRELYTKIWKNIWEKMLHTGGNYPNYTKRKTEDINKF